MNANDVNEYVGLPWESGACGPDSYNCWGLLKVVQEVHFNTPMPDLVMGDEEGIVAAYSEKMRTGAWKIVDTPRHGDGALLRAGSHPHVGVWLDIDGGGVLHSLEGTGVIFTLSANLNSLGFGSTQYYRLRQ